MASPVPPCPRPAPADISRPLVRWYNRHQRDLPWRHTQDPYAIFVSEIMLQQTTVATVLGFYDRFLARFPTWESLAAAPEESVLAEWSGLGYYRRARMLQATAREITLKHHGRLPADLDALLELPGVGRYTAGAVMSFAFGQPFPIVEANSKRVLARLFGVRGPLEEGGAKARLWELATATLPARDSRKHNYALMELGALVCRPQNPDCDACPLVNQCVAYRVGAVADIPPPKARREIFGLQSHCVAICWRGKYLVRRIPAGEWHEGMYEFLTLRADASGTDDGILEKTLRALGTVTDLGQVRVITYTVTHHRIRMAVWNACLSSARMAKSLPGYEWIPLERLRKLPFGSAQRRVLTAVLASKSDDNLRLEA